MTVLTIELSDRMAALLEQRARAQGVSPSQHVSQLLEQSEKIQPAVIVDDRTESVRRMNELFDQVTGFRNDPRVARGDLYER
ncbi:MAG: hypothetical protein NT069_25615 [Planctomycetota bacterium]|nr:hypothetical protein [Planctomycetota bacterium]